MRFSTAFYLRGCSPPHCLWRRWPKPDHRRLWFRGAVFATSGAGFQVSGNAGVAPIEFDNINSTYSSLFTIFSPQRLFTALGSETLSFLGVRFLEDRVAMVRITSGNNRLGPNESRGRDSVVMDDFIFGEPTPQVSRRSRSTVGLRLRSCGRRNERERTHRPRSALSSLCAAERELAGNRMGHQRRPERERGGSSPAELEVGVSNGPPRGLQWIPRCAKP